MMLREALERLDFKKDKSKNNGMKKKRKAESIEKQAEGYRQALGALFLCDHTVCPDESSSEVQPRKKKKRGMLN